MPKRLALWLAWLVILPSAGALAEAASDGWKPGRKAQAPGYAYQVFSKETEGEGFVRYQVRGSIQAPAATLRRSVRVIAADPAHAPDGHTRRLIADDENEFVVYTHIDLPPLFTDRDIVTRGAASVDPDTGTQRVDWKAIEDPRVPKNEDVIRIERSAGFWSFSPNGAASTDVVYETYVDLGGALPGWLINSMMGGIVGENFEDLANEARR